MFGGELERMNLGISLLKQAYVVGWRLPRRFRNGQSFGLAMTGGMLVAFGMDGRSTRVSSLRGSAGTVRRSRGNLFPTEEGIFTKQFQLSSLFSWPFDSLPLRQAGAQGDNILV